MEAMGAQTVPQVVAPRTPAQPNLQASPSPRPGTLATEPRRRPIPAVAPASPGERRASAAFEQARQQGTLALHVFLERMPKGADLHLHLSGAVYAETFLRDAAEELMCVDPVKLALVKNVGTTRSLPPQAVCAEGMVAAASVLTNQVLYDALVDAFSMRSFVPSTGVSGHDHFFASFGRMGGFSHARTGEWLDEVATRAAAQNEQYLEVMQTPAFDVARRLGYEYGWPSPRRPETTAASSLEPDTAGTSPAELAALRDRLLAGGLREEVAANRAEFAEALAKRRELEHCGTPAALPGCTVEIRFLYQVLRAFPPQQVFAQTLLAFEVAAADPDVVGINFVQPEDAYAAMTEYDRQMRMLDYLHGVYPKVHISLHAGELAPGLVPPAGLRFHIREAVELGHAERIGHGVDAMYEQDAAGLLREMAARHVMVEINLTSNDVILGVAANAHSLPLYRAAHVPVSLNTDDEGVSRIDLTHEYVRAAADFHLGYTDLKQMARTGIAHTFLPGADLWQTPDDFTRMAAPCAGGAPGSAAAPACAAFLTASPHAAQQWQLEQRFRVFEATLP